MEWEILLTEGVEAFLDALYETDRDSHRLVNQAILVLERNGPAEGRPLVDTVTASRLPNMKELRPRRRDGPRSGSCSCSTRTGPRCCWWPGTSPASGTAGTARRSRRPNASTRTTWIHARGRSGYE